MSDQRYRLFVPSDSSMLPVEYSSTDDVCAIIDMVNEAICDGFFQFSVVLA